MRNRNASNDALVTEWALSLSRGTKQYIRPVEFFLAQRSSRNLRDATDVEIRDYIATIRASASQTKATSAISSFYNYLHHQRLIDNNPTRALRRRVRARQRDKRLESTLASAGNDRATIRSLRWIDVVPGAGTSSRLHTIPKGALSELRDRLCQHLSSVADAKELEVLLMTKIFEP